MTTLRRHWIAALGVAVGANSAYLAAWSAPTLFYYANVALHVVLGVVAVGVLVYLALAVRRRTFGALRLADASPGLASARSGQAALVWIPFAACAGVGLWLAYTGATLSHQRVLDAHGALAALGALSLAVWFGVTAVRAGRASSRGLFAVAAALLILAVAVPIVVKPIVKRRWAESHRIVNPLTAPVAMDGEGGGRSSPFFPSSARTNVGGTIPANFFMTSTSCGRCHKDIYDQWQSSAHHFSSFNNQWYRKSIEYMQDVVGTQPSKWCAGCHDHAVFFNGRFDRPIKEQIDTPEAQAGLACTSCHSIVHVGSSMGQGDFTVEYPPMHDLAVSDNPVLMRAHDALLYLSPEPHRNTFMKPFHRDQTAEFCSSCHKVHLDLPVNSYRWFRGFNDYDNWQASAVSGQGARSFYYPPKPQRCADCHMPLVASNDPAAKDGKVRSHRFPGANTALPFVNRDPVQLKTVQDFLRDGQISVDVFGIARGAAPEAIEVRGARAAEPQIASTFAVGEESAQFGAAAVLAPAVDVIAPLDKVTATVRRGESVRVEVVVRTRKVGHFFPGGTVDAFDVWVDLEAVDDRGRVILHSGAVADGGKGPVDPAAHFYRSLQLDDHGNPINKRNAWMTRSVAYVRLIPPGAADTVHYRLQIPEDVGDRIYLRAKVNYRKFAWWNTQWAYAGVRDPSNPAPDVTRSHDDGKWVFSGDTSKVSGSIKAIPDIPTTVMAQAESTLVVAARGAAIPEVKPYLDASVRERWNDYGIGLLLQGDLRGAEAAFMKVVAMEPGYADGPVNVARVHIQEGNMAAAMPMLERALKIDPALAKTHYFMGTALKTLGRYEEALTHLQTAAAQYPRDRVVLGQIGRVQFLQRQFKDAIASFERVLAVDPEDLLAHYNLMLCYQGLGNTEAAAREQALYLRFKADESAQAITGLFRLKSADDNNERQQVHEHSSRSMRKD
ncbi:MAG: tetratricopeptide repeat protein [Acidobacteriota bacterium]|nr:tetratricopeptide repeat protein [Acidobacteriota bacterium]